MKKLFPPHLADYYKMSHSFQYCDGSEFIYSNFTPRADNHFNAFDHFDHKYVFFGLQGVIQWMLIDLWNDNFFNQPKDQVVKRYKRRMDRSLGEGKVSADNIAALHELGYLPLKIKALPEGSRVNIRVPPFTFTNTDPRFFWVTNYLETQISSETWKMMTSASTAFEYRRLLERYADDTGVDKSFVDFQGHDFSMRGMSGVWDATQSGAAHLLSFKGTDTISAIDYLEDYYFPDEDDPIGFSVPASEHSVSSSNILKIRLDLQKTGHYTNEELLEAAETEFLKSFITKKYPTGICSYVADTYSFFDVITTISEKLKYVILNRDGKLVFRPDSGNPIDIICGDINATPGSSEFKGAVECLWDIFGGTINEKGYKTLDSHVGLIYGDSISLNTAKVILRILKERGFSSANIVFGIGSFTYNYVTRDTLGTAIKATHAVVNGESIELYKDPKTDSGLKKSAKGLLRVEFENGHYVLYDQQTPEQEQQGLLETVFENGKLIKFQTLSEIRGKLLSQVY